MDILAKASGVLEAYRGRDAALSIAGYNCLMCSGLCSNTNESLKLKLKTASTKIYEARTIFRFLDDYAMLQYTLTYGLGKSEKNLVIRVLTVAGNIMSHLYYVTEKLAFMADNKMINLNAGVLWFGAILNWLLSIVASIVCNVIRLRQLRNQMNFKDTEAKSRVNLKQQSYALYLKLFSDICWLINCVHWLPIKFLWSGKLSEFQSGLFGVLATLSNVLSKV